MTPRHVPWYVRLMWPLFKRVMMREDGGASAEKASRSSVFAATDSSLEGRSSKYLDPNCREKSFHESVRPVEVGSKLIEYI